jgi:UDP-N-acetylglucosamine 2-epimerase (non-hydrolysing)|uniref:UDP-N-acetylglucosamine 2-epimerase domain-containing protein n=1 Tax=candidate division WOR-3 bacterium TaxID=2052148 RepID=A0A7C6ECG7_UNCW3
MVILIGTKGQLVKVAPVMKELQDRNIPYKYVQTDQHPNFNRELEGKFGLKPPDLNLWKGKKDLVKIWQLPIWFLTCFINALRHRKFFAGEKILVTHGDTISTLFACLVGRIYSLKIAHIEAGLRSFNIFHPFPEELVRRISSKLAHILFAPSDWAAGNLQRERGKVINTRQNTVYDTLAIYVKKRPDKEKEKYVVVAIHRQETIYNYRRLKKAIDTVLAVAKNFSIIYILHKTSEHQLKQFGLYDKIKTNPNIRLIGYLDYITFMNLVGNCEFVISDGGGLQEETYFLDVPCLILRNRTEREIGLNETAWLSEFKDERIDYFLTHYQQFHRKKEFVRWYPSKIIVDELIKYEK